MLADLLNAAPNVAVAVDTRWGPHVTPELFVESGGRIWCLVAAPTLKAKVLQKRRRAGLLVQADGVAAVIAADAVVIDPARPLAALGNGLAAVRAPAVVAEFLARNRTEMAGAALDAASLELGAPPPRRVLLGFEPVATAVIADGMVTVAGRWEPTGPVSRAADVDGDVPLDQLPNDLATLLDRRDAALGWTTPVGPLALPATWDGERYEASVSAPLLDAVGAAPSGPCSLMVDDWTALGPTGKRGVMLRGIGEVVRPGVIRVSADRAVYWEGIDTGTVHA